MALTDFEVETVELYGRSRLVYRVGSGPAVIVMSEIPGITPRVSAFARRVADCGLTAVMPHLFGVDGRESSNRAMTRSMLEVCISKEFRLLARGEPSPVTNWLRRLASVERERCGGRGVGAVGMCLTGGFALAMMIEEVVIAPVLSQPSLPLPLGRSRKRDLGIGERELARVKERARAGTCVMGLRFTGDKASPPERFERLREELGDKFLAIELDSSKGNPYGHRAKAHSVLTEDLDDRVGSPTHDAMRRVLEFFQERLLDS